MSTVNQKTELPDRVEEWTREHVHHWLTEVMKVDIKYADRLYEEEVSGEELICYEIKHLQELGVKHDTAVRIITRFKELQKLYEDKSHTDAMPLKHSCSPHPFDENSVSHRYIENDILPPETGPGNLIDPVHEYKFMAGVDDIHVMKKKFNKEVFRFAAGCMNSRTNGTIHFGVADSQNSEYAYGEIVGVNVEKKDVIIHHFYNGFRWYFKKHRDEARACIRPPRFVEVLPRNGTFSGKYVIEVDVVPSHCVVQGKLFYFQTLDEDNRGKKSKGILLFIREGAENSENSLSATQDLCKIGNLKELDLPREERNAQVNVLDNRRKEAEMNQWRS